MSETYLPIKESLGYKNVKKALWHVFSVNLDDIQIREGEDENFAFDLIYHSMSVNIVIAATGKKQQFEIGEGGLVQIFLPDPDYPENSFLKKKSFEWIVKDRDSQEKIRYIFGKRKSEIIFAFKLLKDYLDSDEAKVLLKHE